MSCSSFPQNQGSRQIATIETNKKFSGNFKVSQRKASSLEKKKYLESLNHIFERTGAEVLFAVSDKEIIFELVGSVFNNIPKKIDEMVVGGDVSGFYHTHPWYAQNVGGPSPSDLEAFKSWASRNPNLIFGIIYSTSFEYYMRVDEVKSILEHGRLDIRVTVFTPINE